ncbi:MAG: zinc-binding dehydrogenase [Leptolinea sp.]
MEKTMRAVTYLQPDVLELQHIPIPHPRPGEALVKVKAALTCGTDVKTFKRGHPKFPPPFVFGHEFGGDIVAVGEGITRFQPGMRVTATVNAECGECFYCRKGQGNLCENLEYNFGAFAEYVIVPASIVRKNLFEIPAHVSYAEAAVVEPFVTVVHGQGLVKVQPGEIVAIIGAGGPIGILHAQMALLAGAAKVIAIDRSDIRLEVLKQFGSIFPVNPQKMDALSAVHQETDGYGADVVIECAGTKATWEQSVDLVRKGGRVLWFGGLPGGTKVELDAACLHYGEIKLFNIHGGTAEDAQKAFELITSEKINTHCLLSGEVALEEVEGALQKMIAGEVIKMVVNPQINS